MTMRMLAAGNKTTPIPARFLRILLVEDCKSDVYLMERMLEDADLSCFYDITDVPRLIDAFNRIERDAFDLAMLDLNLLDIDGIAAVAALHAQAPLMPIIVYSGMDDAKLKEKALMCGAVHYLVKGRQSGHGLKSIIERALVPVM
jgi:CheY-like chemotaxis protein